MLSQVYAGQISIAEAEAQISMENMGTFSSLFRPSDGKKAACMDLTPGKTGMISFHFHVWSPSLESCSDAFQNLEGCTEVSCMERRAWRMTVNTWPPLYGSLLRPTIPGKWAGRQ